MKWVMTNTWTINFGLLVFWSILIQLLMWWTNINPLRIVVLLGTFALAMAFAGNDLVNFIGVAVGGYIAFQAWIVSGQSADQFNMSVLSEKFATPTWILLIAGFVMIVTLWTNAKSRKVTETEVSLGRQDEGEEKFKPTWVSRILVGAAIYVGQFVEAIVLKNWSKTLADRFVKEEENEKYKPSFDLIRAAVNLLVSSVLIAFGTSQKLPLSTTFVTFMVAMGSSFADQAWGRESAVYRVAGVMQVIAGWLITAVIAFSSSALLAFILFKTGAPGVFVLVGLVAFLLVRSHVLFAQKERSLANENKIFSSDLASLSQAIDESKEETVKNLKLASKAYTTSIEALAKEKKNAIAKSLDKIQEFGQQNSKVQNKIIKYVRKMPKRNLAASRLYLLIFDYMQDLYQSVQLITESCIDHLSNFHSMPSKEYLKASDEIAKSLSNYIFQVSEGIITSSFKNSDKIAEQHEALSAFINKTVDHVVTEIQSNQIGNRMGLLQMKLLLETKDILSSVQAMYSLYHDYHKQDK